MQADQCFSCELEVSIAYGLHADWMAQGRNTESEGHHDGGHHDDGHCHNSHSGMQTRSLLCSSPGKSFLRARSGATIRIQDNRANVF